MISSVIELYPFQHYNLLFSRICLQITTLLMQTHHRLVPTQPLPLLIHSSTAKNPNTSHKTNNNDPFQKLISSSAIIPLRCASDEWLSLSVMRMRCVANGFNRFEWGNRVYRTESPKQRRNKQNGKANETIPSSNQMPMQNLLRQVSTTKGENVLSRSSSCC